MLLKRLWALLSLMLAAPCAAAPDYAPPTLSTRLLGSINFDAAQPVDADYSAEFTKCDGTPHVATAGKDHFRGFDLRRYDKNGGLLPQQYYLCSNDPSNVRVLLKLEDGGIYWDSKMALDVDGSWAAWNGRPGATDLKLTAYHWPGMRDSTKRAAQIDPDMIPYAVMPTDGKKAITGAKASELGREFASTTGLHMGDMGVVIYGDRWSPALIGDGGPFMRLGEASSRVFEALGKSRCKQWNVTRTTCIGLGGAYPYKNSSLSKDVLFIFYPGSRDPSINAANAIARLCTFAKTKLNLTGGAMCP